jgi:hypothetical protein
MGTKALTDPPVVLRFYGTGSDRVPSIAIFGLKMNQGRQTIGVQNTKK